MGKKKTDDIIHSWVRIDAFLAEKYHYSPSQIAELTPTECLWLCVNWDVEEEDNKITATMDEASKRIRQLRTEERLAKITEYHLLPAEKKLKLAERGIYCAADYIQLWKTS